jgi:hypothetical protein
MMNLHWLAYFLGGAFFTNAIPHWVSGLTGRSFQTPFAKPSGKGLSSSTVNVFWAAFNLFAAYLLIVQVGAFDLRDTADMVSLGLGALILSAFSARHFGSLHGGNRPEA